MNLNLTNPKSTYCVNLTELTQNGQPLEWLLTVLQKTEPIKLGVLAKMPCECQLHTASGGKQCAEASRLQLQFRDSKVKYLDPLNEWYHMFNELLYLIVEVIKATPESKFPEVNSLSETSIANPKS